MKEELEIKNARNLEGWVRAYKVLNSSNRIVYIPEETGNKIIDVDFLIKLGACDVGIDWFLYRFGPGGTRYIDLRNMISVRHKESYENWCKMNIERDIVGGMDRHSIGGHLDIAYSGDNGFSATDDYGISITKQNGVSKSGTLGLSISGYFGKSVSDDAGISVSGSKGISMSGINGKAATGADGAIIIRSDNYKDRYTPIFFYEGKDIKPWTYYAMDKDCKLLEKGPVEENILKIIKI